MESNLNPDCWELDLLDLAICKFQVRLITFLESGILMFRTHLRSSMLYLVYLETFLPSRGYFYYSLSKWIGLEGGDRFVMGTLLC